MDLDAREKVLGMDEMVTEIAVCIPPTEPARLVHLALVSKSWQRVLTSSNFLRAYARRHGRPPFLGYFHGSPSPVSGREIDRFVPAAAAFPSFSPDVGTYSWYTLDVRQGRVLLLRASPDIIVWLPMTGEHFLLPEPPRSYQYQAGAVICAESPQCRDPECCSIHYFRVIFVGCDDKLVTFNNQTFFEGNETWACIYSEETDEWGECHVLKDDRYTEHPLVDQNPPVLHSDNLYFMLEMHEMQGEEVRGALKFNLTSQKLSVVLAPEEAHPDFGIFLGTSEGIAFAGIEEEDDEEGEIEEQDEGGIGQNNLSVWTMSDSDLDWSLTWNIDLEAALPIGAIQPAYIPSPIGFIEGEEATICIDSGGRIFTIELNSLKTTDIGPSTRAQVLPFFHFYMASLPKAKDDEDTGANERGIASEETGQKTGVDAVGVTEDEGTNALVEKRNTATKADVIGTKRRIQTETSSGKKVKGDQSGQAEEPSSGEDSDQDSWF